MLQTKDYVNLKKYLIFLFFILLPAVSASSFTGSFSDYGKDTGSDGMYNYLTIEAGVNINNSNKDYMILGVLEDSQGNLIEYNNCRSVTATGNQIFILDFNGLEIYRNQVDGPYTLALIELSSVSDCIGRDFPILEDSLTNAHTTSFYNYNQFQKGKPAIYCNISPCTAPPALIKSRDNLTTPEPNAPNTIDNCKDGTSGQYQKDESIESITITSLNNTFFKPGDTIQVQAQVYCSNLYAYDHINFVYSNNIDNIQWEVKGNSTCPSQGLRTLSGTFKLDNKVGQQAVRGVFGFTVNPDTVCSQDELDDTLYWTDNDDLVINVKYPMYITKGWSLISLPKIGNNSITEISKLFNFEKIIALKEGKWYIYDKTLNSNLDELSEADGFWIKASNNQTVLIDSAPSPFTSFNLIEGWNLIGYPSMQEQDINLLFQNVMDDIELIYVYNNEFKSFNPQKPISIIIKPGMGIFVKVKNDVSWYFDNAYKKGQLSFNLTLSQGWNLISLPLASNKTVSEIFSSNSLYYLENNNWKQIEGTDKINYSYAYWLKANQGTLPIQGYPLNNINYNINKGWNLINYPLTQDTSVGIFLQNVIANVELVHAYENGQWKTFSPSKTSQLNSLNTLKPGKGLFIKAKNNANWRFNGNELVTT